MGDCTHQRTVVVETTRIVGGLGYSLCCTVPVDTSELIPIPYSTFLHNYVVCEYNQFVKTEYALLSYGL